MPKDRKQYFKDYYSRNRDTKLSYQNEYYRKTKEFAKESLELLKLFEPEIYAKKKKAYKDYQAAYRKKIREKRKNQSKWLMESVLVTLPQKLDPSILSHFEKKLFS